MKPSIGRIVHYGYVRRRTSSHGAVVEQVDPMVVCAAIITYVYPDDAAVNLSVFDPSGNHLMGQQAVKYSDTIAADKWTWPPRVS